MKKFDLDESIKEWQDCLNNQHKKKVNAPIQITTQDVVVNYIASRIFIVLLISAIIGFILIAILKSTGHWISGMGYSVLFSVPLIFVSFISSAIIKAFPPDENSKLFRDLEQSSINDVNQGEEELQKESELQKERGWFSVFLIIFLFLFFIIFINIYTSY